MITYDLRCGGGHLFEAWFRDRASYLAQRDEGLVECPSCGSREVDIAFTGCAVHTERRTAIRPRDSLLQELARFLEKNFDDVGARFADEARDIHYGRAERRNIRGCTTEDEEQALREEGIEFLKVPVPKLDG